MVGFGINSTTFNNALSGIVSQNPSVNMKQSDEAHAKAAAQDFEAFFLTRMMESMFEGVSTNGLFGGGEAEKMYRSLLLDEYGKEMAKLGGIGVQDQVMRTILDMQEMASNGYIERA